MREVFKQAAIAMAVIAAFPALARDRAPTVRLPILAQAEVGAKTYHAVGVVTGVDQATGVLTISHEDIPGLMNAMEMAFQTKPVSLARGLQKGDRVEFVLEGKTYTILDIKKR